MNQWFAPTRLSITFEREGQGSFSKEQIEQIVVRNAEGKVVALKLPTKSILIANHQVRTFYKQLYGLAKAAYVLCVDVRRLVVRLVFDIFHGHA
jgi:hypothetical protein